MSAPIICTIIAPNYLSQARALTESFVRHEPSGKVYVLIVTTERHATMKNEEQFTAIPVQDLALLDFPAMVLRYTVRELCTAVKPFFLQHLLDRYNVGKICYVDPDIYFYHNIRSVWEQLNTHNVVLTPHILQPLDEEFLPNEFSILQAGTYNLGFIGVRNTEETQRFLAWWGGRLVYYSHGAPERHEHFDQRWIDLLPGFLPDVFIDRNPGLNVAYWDLSNRYIQEQSQGYYVNGAPLIFFHFSGYSPDQPEIISKHQNRFTFTNRPELRPIFNAYGKALIDHGYHVQSGTVYKRRTKSAGNTGPVIYQRITKYLANLGLESILTTVLGKKLISAMRSLFFVTRTSQQKTLILSKKKGVNVFGFTSDLTGIGKIARSTRETLAKHNMPVIMNNALQPYWHKERYRVNIIHANADVVRDIVRMQKLNTTEGQYTVGYWWWELNRFPDAWKTSFTAVNELWVGSAFVQNALLPVTTVPVFHIGVPIEPSTPKLLYRNRFGIEKDAYIFLFIFDLRSYVERKNPYAVIHAYRQAFGEGNPNVKLVIKASHTNEFPRESKKLREALASVSGLFIDTMMPRDELSGLFCMSDAYISLHRSEGFGLTVAEAMYFGKPVIATNYSGNTDYMTKENSYPVDYNLITIQQTVGPYERGNTWADPDIAHAAHYMQYLCAHREEATNIGKKAAQDIRRLYSQAIIAQRMRERIDAIYEDLAK